MPTGDNLFAKKTFLLYSIWTMSFKRKIKKSKFTITCVYFALYALYAAYAIIYYARYKTALGVLLIISITATLIFTAATTFLSYRINLLDEKHSNLSYLIKIAKHTSQLLTSITTIAMVFSAVQNTNVFSLIFAIASIPTLTLGILINVIANRIEKKIKNGIGRVRFIPKPLLDDEGNEISLLDLNLKQEENSPALRYFKKDDNTKTG